MNLKFFSFFFFWAFFCGMIGLGLAQLVLISNWVLGLIIIPTFYYVLLFGGILGDYARDNLK